MYRGWPTGTIILWNGGVKRGREFGSLRGDPIDVTADSLVLDGQQRITTLQLLRRNGRIELESGHGNTVTQYFYFDVDEKKFINSRERNLDSSRYIRAVDIIRGKLNVKSLKRRYQKQRKSAINQLKSIPDYSFPIDYTYTTSDEEAIEIFNRVNTAGRKVDKVELAFARLKDEEPAVTRRIVAFQKTFAKEGYDLSPRVLINSFLITMNINKEGYISTRNADAQIKNYLSDEPHIDDDWRRILRRVRGALHLLDLEGFDSDQFLTAENTIAVLAGFLERHDVSPTRLSPQKRNLLRKWLYSTLAFGRYTKTTNFLRDLDSLQEDGKFYPPQQGTYSPNGTVAVMYAMGRKNRMTDYEGNEITWKDTREGRVIHIDHIYPYSRMTNGPIAAYFGSEAESLAESIGNKAFAIGEANISKSQKFPGGKIKGEVSGQWMDGLHLLDDSDFKEMNDSDSALGRYCREIKSFIKHRAKRIEKDIKLQIT